MKYSTAVNHYTALNLTKIDVLDNFPEIKVATAYKVDGQILESFPADLDVLARAEVVYETLAGWMTSTTGITRWDDLPGNAKRYIDFIEQFLGGPKCKYIGTGESYHRLYQIVSSMDLLTLFAVTGPNREHMIVR